MSGVLICIAWVRATGLTPCARPDQGTAYVMDAQSAGIHHVLVNGELALENEQLTGAIAGEAIP